MCFITINKIKRHLNIFTIMSIVIGILILLPIVNILFEFFGTSSATWEHIRTYLLREYILNSIILIILVGIMTLILGFTSAYFVARYNFKGRKFLSWMLVIPLAVPSYIAGYVYADMFSYTGTIGRFLSSIGMNGQINIMNMLGASLIFAFTLYPYVYLLTLTSLSRQSSSYLESATLLGASKWKRLVTVTIPLARPALVAGTLLVILETLNDYGVVQYFNVRVFSFAIFNAWFSLGDITSAIRLSAYLMVLVFAVILIERAFRGRKQYQMHVKTKLISRRKIHGWKQVGVTSFLWFILAIGFLIPIMQLLYYLVLTIHKALDIRLLIATMNTVVNSVVTAGFIVIIALFMVNFSRLNKRGKASKSWVRLANLGYAIPGAVIAVAVHVFFVDLDRLFAPIYSLINPNGPSLVITVSLFTLIFAYILRFLSIGFNSIESQYEKIGTKFTESAYTLGSGRLDALIRVDIPLIFPGLVGAFILSFIDIIKELPLTLILRPANYDSLSTYIYTYARDEMIQESSLPSLILITIAGVLIYLLTHYKKGLFNNVY
ncbi:MAG: iron ABC transporter permease [Firmicutes bacterium]|nr:iron ABC transporter permease [Bacillota bacterium]